jgi:hypothetical protein
VDTSIPTTEPIDPDTLCAPLLQLLSNTELTSSPHPPKLIAELVHAAVVDLKKADWRARAAVKRAGKKQRQQQQRQQQQTRQQQQHQHHQQTPASTTYTTHPTSTTAATSTSTSTDTSTNTDLLEGVEYPALEHVISTGLQHHSTALVVGVYAGLAGQLPPQHRLLRLMESLLLVGDHILLTPPFSAFERCALRHIVHCY